MWAQGRCWWATRCTTTCAACACATALSSVRCRSTKHFTQAHIHNPHYLDHGDSSRAPLPCPTISMLASRAFLSICLHCSRADTCLVFPIQGLMRQMVSLKVRNSSQLQTPYVMKASHPIFTCRLSTSSSPRRSRVQELVSSVVGATCQPAGAPHGPLFSYTWPHADLISLLLALSVGGASLLLALEQPPFLTSFYPPPLPPPPSCLHADFADSISDAAWPLDVVRHVADRAAAAGLREPDGPHPALHWASPSRPLSAL